MVNNFASLLLKNSKRIFTSFAIEDKFARDNLVFQSKDKRAPFNFIDMSVKKPWDTEWKTNCRTKIKGCDGVIAFISSNTPDADGARWEIKCALEERIPLRAIWVHKDKKSGRPPELGNALIYEWSWENVKNFIDNC